MRPEYALPMAASLLIPHRTPMRLVDTLLSVHAGGGVTESVLPRTSMLADGGGRLDEVAFMEMIAQSYAAFKGYMDLVEGKPAGGGLLVGVRRLEVTGRADAGDRLLTSVRTGTSFGGFADVLGSVTRGDEAVASGIIKLWLAEDGR